MSSNKYISLYINIERIMPFLLIFPESNVVFINILLWTLHLKHFWNKRKSFNANIRVRDFIIIIKMLCIILLYEALYVSCKQIMIVWVTFYFIYVLKSPYIKYIEIVYVNSIFCLNYTFIVLNNMCFEFS